MATVIGIFEEAFKRNFFTSCFKMAVKSRRFTNIDDTILICYLAWKKIYQDIILFQINKAIQF